jgi:putative transposase
MTRGLVRYQKCGVFHFLTFSCYRRRPLLAAPGAYGIFEHELERVRKRYGLLGEPRIASLAVALQVLKQAASRKLKQTADAQFWQRRYYDFNVHSELKRVEKLRYMHRNPVRRGLAEKPEDWPWSSFVHYATGKIGTVEIESEWTAQRRAANRMLVSAMQPIPPLR